jgi:enoyl-CoA hydratase/carnithine racemase
VRADAGPPFPGVILGSSLPGCRCRAATAAEGERPMAELETVKYREDGNVAWVTLARPQVHNAFNTVMQRELRSLWRWLRHRHQVRVVVLTGAGDEAFCTGVDQREVIAQASAGAAEVGDDPTAFEHEPVTVGFGPSPFMYDDPGRNLGPKTNDLWKPVVAAVNGMACGGAFYLLGEVEFIIAAEHATFFDPHLTYGLAASYEPLQLTGALPFGELARMTLLGAEERMSAQRAHQVGFVSEVVPLSELHERAAWAASVIARAHPVAVQSTLRALWTGRSLGRAQALALAWAFVSLGDDEQALDEGRTRFSAGHRVDWRLR